MSIISQNAICITFICIGAEIAELLCKNNICNQTDEAEFPLMSFKKKLHSPTKVPYQTTLDTSLFTFQIRLGLKKNTFFLFFS